MIDSTEALRAFAKKVAGAEWVAVDTEFLRERTYKPALCLLQIATAQAQICIDPLAIDDLSPLQPLFTNAATLKIFHSCRQDLEALDTRINFSAMHLYDSQLAAAFCGYGGQTSYAALVESLCDVKLAKSHTRADWSRRPLSAEELQYAVDDVKYLQPLRAALDEILARKGRGAWHRDECARVATPEYYLGNPDESWRLLKGLHLLNSTQQAVAKKLAVWREHTARARNLPRNWVLESSALLQICRTPPQTTAELRKINGIGAATARRSGAAIMEIITAPNEDAADAKLTGLNADQRRRMKKIMQRIAARAAQEEISRELLTNRHEVENFIRGETDSPLFKGWRRDLIGAEILQNY